MVGCTDRFVAYMRTLAHPSRQVHQAVAQPFQPTDVEKKHEEEIDKRTALTKRHAEEHADEKQSRVLLLQAAAFRQKLRDVEAKHANQLRAVLDGQEELMRQKEELEKKIEKLEIEQREAFNSFTAQRAKQRSSHHTIVKRLGVTLQNALGGVAERKGKWFRPAKQDVTSEINGLVFIIGTMTDLLDRMMAVLLEASQELELGEDYPGEEFMLARVLGSMRRRILASEKLKSGLHHQIDRRVPEILERALPSSDSIELKLDSLFDRVDTAFRAQKKAALDQKNMAVTILECELNACFEVAYTALPQLDVCDGSLQERFKSFWDLFAAQHNHDFKIDQKLITELRASANKNSMSLSRHGRKLDLCVRSYINAVDDRLGSVPRYRELAAPA
ncbi:uncharacterized protein J4E78_001663 [Alternaria triticimaculans]|uniref:uncharacterized protein n=1 Tax=Alternaria triticimaculans TaxID=297637 RepID=UPI0020C3A714|nr:uncharacterized protein J4E78_001663 [Alternaria triticimaculans]KAI4673156.1 hypothetical protein J4E78_001663 [Alternaria triticimaculans]